MIVGLFLRWGVHTEDDGHTWAQSDVTDGGFFGNSRACLSRRATRAASICHFSVRKRPVPLHRRGRAFTKLTDVSLLGLAVHPTQSDSSIWVRTSRAAGFSNRPMEAPHSFRSRRLGLPAIAIDPRRPESSMRAAPTARHPQQGRGRDLDGSEYWAAIGRVIGHRGGRSHR